MDVKMSHEQVKANAIKTLHDGLDAGFIYKARFTESLSALSSHLDNLFFSGGYYLVISSMLKRVGKDDQINSSEDSLIRFKDWSQKVEKAIGGFEDDLGQFIEEWMGYADLVEKVRPLIVKGKPKKESHLPQRTLENTGTCPACRRNVKLDPRGRIWEHGYTLQPWGRNGSCPCTRQLPFEVSPDGLVYLASVYEREAHACDLAYAKAEAWETEYRIPANGRIPAKILKPGDFGYQTKRTETMNSMEHAASVCRKYAEKARHDVEAWVPSELPGIKSGFRS